MLLQFVIRTKGLKPTIHIWKKTEHFQEVLPKKKMKTAYGVFSQLRKNNLISQEHFADGQNTLCCSLNSFLFLKQSQGSET